MSTHRFDEGHKTILGHVPPFAIGLLPVLRVDPRVIRVSVARYFKRRAAVLRDFLAMNRFIPDAPDRVGREQAIMLIPVNPCAFRRANAS